MKRRLLAIPTILVGMFIALALSGCNGHAPDVYTVQPSQTGILIPLDDASAQAKLQSVQYLHDHLVSAKQVVIGYHGLSDNNNGTNWYPKEMLVIVDRAMVSRDWTSNSTASSQSQSFPIKSSDGISYRLDATCTGSITESDAPTYLFYNPSKTNISAASNQDLLEVNSLPIVMDTNVRDRLNSDLAKYFTNITYVEAQARAAELFNRAVIDTTKYFADRGVTLTACGIQGGPQPDDPSVSRSFVTNVTNANLHIQAEAAATATAIVVEAQANSTIKQAAAAATAQVIQSKSLTPEYLQLKYLEQWNGQLPQFGGSGTAPSFILPLPTPAH